MDERLRRAAQRGAAVSRRLWRPAVNVALLFVVVQVIFSQSRTAQAAWARAKGLAPDPVLDAAGAVADTPLGRAVGYAAAGVHAGADWAFRPFRSTVAAQHERGRAAAQAAAEFRRRVEEAREATRRPAPQPVIGATPEQ